MENSNNIAVGPVPTPETTTVMCNKYIACEPYKEAAKSGGMFSQWQLENPVMTLVVVFGDKEGEYKPGSTVFIRPQIELPGYMKEILTIEGKKVILIPKDFIIGTKFAKEPPAPYVVPYFQTYPWTTTIDTTGIKWPSGSGLSSSVTWIHGVGSVTTNQK